MMKKKHILHWAMGVVMTPLLGSCAFDELHEIAGGGNGVLSFGVEVNAGAPEVKPMGGATRSGDRADSSATGNAVMSPDVDGFFPTSSVELSSVDGKTLYANCDERRGINMHNNVDYKITRGSIQTTENFYDSFALYGYVYDSGKSWANVGSSTNVDNNIKGIEMTKGSDNIWKASSVYWPGGSKNATFFAVAPKDCFGVTISADQGGSQITYTVPQEVSKQEDFLIAKSQEDVTCDGKNAPSLEFNHALAAIKFVKGDNLGNFTSISNVEISGVYNKGTLSSFDNPAWTIDETVTNTYTISELSNVLFLMPQIFTDEAEIKVTFSDGSNSQDFTAKLKDVNNSSWQAGHQYTYELSVNKVTGTFYFSVDDVNVAQDAITADITVNSYFEYNDGSSTKIPIKWSVTGLAGDKGTYVINGSEDAASRTVTLNFSANTDASGQDATLQAKAEVGTENDPVDLSIRTKNGTQVRETANCYVINAPGWYMFPLVYGNGIKSNSTNYVNNFTGFKGAVFTTHDNSKKMSSLASPWIDESYAVSSCELLWQDAEKLIEYNSYKIVDVGGMKYMKFHISKSNIKQGNAVLAVKNSSQILWSWHIWVTALDVYSTQTVTSTYSSTPQTFNFMPVPLGWHSASETVNPKTYTLSVKQEGSGKTANGTVTQAGQTGSVSGTCTFYQWGRKDPFPPSDGSSFTSNNNKTVYKYDPSGKSTTLSWSQLSSQATIATSILSPSTFYFGYANWCSQSSNELWNVGNNATDVNFNSVTKSVYDPSPAGFRLPETAAFTGFTVNGANGGTRNGTWNSTTNGYTFTTNNVETYWQACGYRAYDSGSLNLVGSDGYYWSAGPSSTMGGRYLSFGSSYVNPQNSYYRAIGFSVRPVSE